MISVCLVDGKEANFIYVFIALDCSLLLLLLVANRNKND